MKSTGRKLIWVLKGNIGFQEAGATFILGYLYSKSDLFEKQNRILLVEKSTDGLQMYLKVSEWVDDMRKNKSDDEKSLDKSEIDP